MPDKIWKPKVKKVGIEKVDEVSKLPKKISALLSASLFLGSLRLRPAQ